MRMETFGLEAEVQAANDSIGYSMHSSWHLDGPYN